MIALMIEHQNYIRQSYQLAISARDKGNHPFGALMVIDGEVVSTAENSVITDHDITRHAELNLVSELTRQFDPGQLNQGILYSSTEPCAMCSGAIFWSGISNIVYGCSSRLLGEIAGGAFVVPCRDLLAYGKRQISVTGPVLEAEGAAIHRSFWNIET